MTSPALSTNKSSFKSSSPGKRPLKSAPPGLLTDGGESWINIFKRDLYEKVPLDVPGTSCLKKTHIQ